jgi:acyl-coenzyme A synthetase/AMP-(fatty) acid ligase
VAESAVVGYSHAILGEGIFAYIILREDGKSVPEEQLINELKQNVKQKIAGYAVPHGILVSSILEIVKNNMYNIFDYISRLLLICPKPDREKS